MTAPLQPTLHTHNDFGTANVVETPTSPSSAFTLSRFEFEAGTKGNEGTKILMVEWDATAALKAAAAGRGDGQETQSAASEQQEAETSASPDEWEVRWEGKEILSSNNTVIGIPDPETPPSTCRVYFLLPPKAPIPTLVTIAHAQGAVADLHAKPLPAIFPEGLVKQQHGGGDAHDEDKKTKKKKEGLRSGTRGVLHTIWAELRVAQLDAEVAAEMRVNGEGVGLEMALQERQWIVERFGLQVDTSSAEAIPPAPEAAGSPASPRSPMGGRLGEKLKGLKLATSPAELAAAKEANQHPPQPKPFTAVVPPDSASAAGFQPLAMATGSAAAGSGMASLSAMMQGGGPGVPDRGGDTEEDLFALPMSPRSPEMAMSPFSLLKS